MKMRLLPGTGCFSESLFNHLADAVNRKRRKFCPVCRKIRMGLELQNARCKALFSRFLDAGKAMDKCIHSSNYKHCTMKELVDFIQLVSVNGKKIQSGSSHQSLQLHKLDFLTDFIRFAALQGVGRDKLQELLSHTEVVVITVAFCCYLLWKPQVMDRRTRSIIYSQYSELLKVLPVIILKTSRSSNFFLDDFDLLEAFINSLLAKHLKLLASSSSSKVSVVKILFKELRFLRNFLKVQRQEEDADLNEEIANLICDVVSEARMLFCSVSLDDVKEDTEIGLSNWMEKVQFLKQDVANKYPETSRYRYKFPRTDELDPILMAPKLSDLTLKLPDSTRKLSYLIDTLRSYLSYLEDLTRSTYQWDIFCPIKTELRLAQTTYSCLDVFFLQNLTSESEDQSLESFHKCLGVAINKEARDIYSAIQEIREGSELRKANGRQAWEVYYIMTSFSHVLEFLKLFLFEEALDKYMLSSASKHCTMEELLDFIQLVSEEGREIHSGRSLKSLQLHKLEFLKNFIILAASLGVGEDKLQDLLAHAKVVVTTAAYYSYMLWTPEVTDSTTRSLINSQYLSMLKVQLNSRESYIGVLKALGSSCSSNNANIDDDMVGLFIDSLLENHWELLTSESSFIVSIMKILIEELRFLRNVFIYKRQEGGNLDGEIANLLFDMVSEAGILIYYLSWDNPKEVYGDTKLALLNWMEKVRIFKENVSKKYPETSRYKFPMINELGFMDALLEDLKELISYNLDSIAFARGHLAVILEDLVYLRDLLREIVKKHNEHHELKALWFRVVDVAYMSEFVINSLVVGDPSPYSGPTSINAVKEEIKKIRTEVDEIYTGKSFQFEALNTPKISSNLPSRSSNPTMDEVMVGFEDEAEKIIDRLEANSAELDIISIVGMPGGGKTTLAKKVYNDIRSHFHVCAWCCVSQGYQKRKLLLDLLSDRLDDLPTGVHEKSDEDLEKALYQSLKGRRYLIILDDIWDIEAWRGLQSSFPDDQNKSRILITSRIYFEEPEVKPYSLRQLNLDESNELLQKKLLHNKACPANLWSLGMKIAKICKGLPLAIVTVAGILETLEQDSWEEFAEGLTTSLVSGAEQCTELLELSYIHLPDYLKPCLLYFGSFLQDEEIPVSRLIWLWIAEGFLQKTIHKKRLEDVADSYLKDLINRSLVTVVKQTSRGGIKTCSVHDLVHQFCVTRAKEENFLQVLNLAEKIGPLFEPRRLCFYSWEGVQCFRRVSSLKFFPHSSDIEVSSILCSFKILKVLDLRGICCSLFPDEVEMLVHLRFLALAGSFNDVPSTIVKLWNLEIFLLGGSKFEVGTLLPYTLFKMTKLRHLCVNNFVYFGLPEQNFDECKSCNLETFSTPYLSSEIMVKIIRKMPYLRKLKCTFFQSWDEYNQFPALDFLSQLESLKVCSLNSVRYVEFNFPVNLKKLTLSNLSLPWTSISRFAQLPNLEILKLLNRACEGETWDMQGEAFFPNLQFLKLEDLDIVYWNTCSDNFPCLRHLVLHKCRELQGIPSGLEEVDTLEMVEVKYCHRSVATSAQSLKEEREGLKVSIHGLPPSFPHPPPPLPDFSPTPPAPPPLPKKGL